MIWSGGENGGGEGKRRRRRRRRRREEEEGQETICIIRTVVPLEVTFFTFFTADMVVVALYVAVGFTCFRSRGAVD